MNQRTQPDKRIRKSIFSARTLYAIILPIFLAAFSAVAVADFVPFVIPAGPNPDSLIAAPAAGKIDTDSPRLIAEKNHFQRDGQRIRLWGVNLSMAANFPTHQAASQIAARMAQAGVNTVRCHHMDTSNWPRGIWDPASPGRLSPEALDRLDFFIDQLARKGICVNINLHVGRAHTRSLGLPATNTDYDKIVSIFTPAIIDAQKKYARDLLTHRNKYRNIRYADDPAVAVVEITNENSLFMWNGDEKLRVLPEYYEKILHAQFNAWLKTRYRSDDRLRAAWAEGAEPLGQNLIKNSDFEQPQPGQSIPLHWNLEQHDQSKARCSRQQLESKKTLKINIEQADQTEWHIQFNQRGLTLEKGKYYTVTFEAAADAPRSITCAVGQAGEPWANLGLSQKVRLTDKMTEYRFGFTAVAGETNARLSFSIGADQVPVRFANVRLRPGGRIGLREDESIGKANIALYAQTESPRRILDRMIFLAETEKKYFDLMRNYIKKDLNCKALVTGTIVFGPLGLYAQSDMDFIDAHAYWQHPRFPNRPWDAGDWLIDQKPMTDFPEQATLFRLAAERLAGKPFTVSEYNHPAPLDSQAECVPMIASFAAAQDWDGIWFYTYSHASDDWDRQTMNSYFDIDTNPAKWGFMRAGAAVFRFAGIDPLPAVRRIPLNGPEPLLDSVAGFHLRNGSNMFAVAREAARIDTATVLAGQIAQTFAEKVELAPDSSERGSLRWAAEKQNGIYAAFGPKAWVLTGHAEKFESATRGLVRVNGPEFLTMVITALDNQDLRQSTSVLIAACGRCENTEMQFASDRRTVGRNWGRAPVRIEPVDVDLVLSEGKWTCRGLAPDGTLAEEVPIEYENGRGNYRIAPRYKTMWYLLTRL
ncbi:MAG: carbohydrate binding domain-containing protein [Sedimentisphaerales bacterium]|nr:carbohydrate binding domain-containing protein [Sedimentisphaerales bacterium]